jgi:hypothetical protein
LGAVQEFELTLTADSTFQDQKIDLSIARDGLPEATLDKEIAITLSTTHIELTPGQAAQVKVRIETTPLASSFAGVKFSINAKSQSASAQTQVPLTVLPVLTIRVAAGDVPKRGPMKWSRPFTVKLKKHTPNVTLKFINDDPNSPELIHGGGGIPHQDFGSELPANDGKASEESRTYTVVITKQTPFKGYYYSHTFQDEDSNPPHYIEFNN